MRVTPRRLALALALVAAASFAFAQGPVKVTVVETWAIHNETMGAAVAAAKGFFDGLDVSIIGGGPGISPVDRVLAEAATGSVVFGVDSPANILDARERRGLPLVVVAHDFQRSAVRLISWSEIRSAREIQGKVAVWPGYDKPLKAAIGPAWSRRIQIVDQLGDPASLGAWLKKDYSLAHAMTYNELLVVRRLVNDRYFVYDFADFGIDWPENVVFTTEATVRAHPQVVQAFVTGRYRGFAYGLANRDEAMQILIRHNPALQNDVAHELEGMNAIATLLPGRGPDRRGFGAVDGSAWQRMARDLMQAGFYTSTPNVRGAYTTAFPSGVFAQ